MKKFCSIALFFTICLLAAGFSGTVLAKSNYTVYQPAPYVQNNVVNQTKSDVIELVMDYSGSMSSWINTAKSAMQSILPQIPASTHVGLRVFGQGTQYQGTTVNSNNLLVNIGSVLMNSLGSIASSSGINSCQATELVSPLASINSSSLISGMNSTAIGGSTPLTLALEKTVYSDFAGLPLTTQKKIILVTDGGENCGKDPCAFVKNLAASRKDIRIDVIMLGSGSKLSCLSDATGGKFYNINSNSDFSTALGVTFETKPEDALKNTSDNAMKNLPETQNNQGYYYQYLPE